jgi:hypothetical protein
VSGHAWSQKAPRLEHLGERAGKRQSRRSGHLGGHLSGAEPGRSRQGGHEREQSREEAGKRQLEDGDVSTRSRVEATPDESWPPPKHDADGTVEPTKVDAWPATRDKRKAPAQAEGRPEVRIQAEA